MNLKALFLRLTGKEHSAHAQAEPLQPAEPTRPAEPPRPAELGKPAEPPRSGLLSHFAEPSRDELEGAREAADREKARYRALFGTDITYELRDEADRAFWKQCAALPELVRACLAYDLARQKPPHGHHAPYAFYLMKAPGPIWSHCWARTEPVPGVAFGIERACFAGRDPLLFYAYGMSVPADLPPEEAKTDSPSWIQELYGTIEGYSSGIRLEGLRGGVILFRLEERNIRKLDILVDAAQPDYVFTWPGAGEFACVLGEVEDGKMIPLYLDDFVMK